jgi:basic membrane protein A
MIVDAIREIRAVPSASPPRLFNRRLAANPSGARGTVLRSLLCVATALCAFGGIRSAAAVQLTALAIMEPEEPTDFSWNQQGFNAAKAVAAKYGLKFMPATGLGYDNVHAELRELADDGASLIIAHASGYNTAGPEIAAEKHVAVAICDRPEATKPGLVADYTLSGRDAAYLAGVLAVRMTRNRAIGIVTTSENPDGNTESAAFAQGVRATDPKVKLMYAVVGPAAFSDVVGGRRVTESVIGAGADVIYGRGDRASFGMLQATETKKSTSGGTVWFIDTIGDKTAIDKGTLLSAVVWNLEPVYSAMVEDLKNNRFGTHGYTIRLADDSVRLLHTHHIPDAVWAEIQGVRQQIINGKITVQLVWDAQTVRSMMTTVAAPK